jgi:hypothetical protein
MFALTHDDINEGFYIWANLCGLTADAHWYPILMETMMRWNGSLCVDCWRLP